MDLDRDNKRAQRKRKRVPEDAEEDDGWQVKPDAEPQTLQDFGKEVAETAAANCLLGARVDCSSCAPSSIADLSVRARQIADKIENGRCGAGRTFSHNPCRPGNLLTVV